MTDRNMTRRDAMEAALALGGGLGIAAAGLASSTASAATRAGIEALQLEDPKARARRCGATCVRGRKAAGISVRAGWPTASRWTISA